MARDASSGRCRVVLVEDDDRMRERLARSVRQDPRLDLTHECRSLGEARRAVARDAPDVLLVDLGLPDGNGVDLIRELRAAGAPTQSMVITVLGDERTVLRAIESGATGYLLKDDPAHAIGAAIEELRAGGSPISAPIARLLLRRLAAGPSPSSAEGVAVPAAGQASVAAASPGNAASGVATSLTAREQEVLNLVAKGFTFPEIARLLAVSVHTVTSHVRHIYEKLEVSSRGEAVFEAVQQGLIHIRG